MSYKTISLLGLLLTLSFISQGQSTIDNKIEEVYGTDAGSISGSQYEWIQNCYERCVVVEEAELPDGVSVSNLSDVGLIDKFVTGLSADTSYDPSTFNPLKYSINFHKKHDQYFRIGSGTSILKVIKKAD